MFFSGSQSLVDHDLVYLGCFSELIYIRRFDKDSVISRRPALVSKTHKPQRPFSIGCGLKLLFVMAISLEASGSLNQF